MIPLFFNRKRPRKESYEAELKRKRLATEKESWEEFGNKRNNAKKPGVGKVPSNILVQKMSSTASGRLKKYEPLDTRDFVPFEDDEELNLENFQEACERFYNAPAGSCDLLESCLLYTSPSPRDA